MSFIDSIRQIFNKSYSNPEKALRVISGGSYNSFDALKTSITTSATKIEVPEGCQEIYVMHVSSGVTIWIGKDETITADGDNVFPLVENVPIKISLKKENENGLYGIVASGSESVYVGGAINE